MTLTVNGKNLTVDTDLLRRQRDLLVEMEMAPGSVTEGQELFGLITMLDAMLDAEEIA